MNLITLFKNIVSFTLSVALLALFLSVNCVFGDTNTCTEEFLCTWMKNIPNDTLLNKIAIPGSHDAGTSKLMWVGKTQDYPIGEQLTFGARYFDIRVNKTATGYPIFHGSLNGVDFRETLEEIKGFIEKYPSEVLLLDFQHFKGDSQSDVCQFLKEKLDANNLILHNTTKDSDVTFINKLTLGKARGKCIVFYGETDNDFSDWIFLRNDDECTKDNMCLDSYYIGSRHKEGTDALIHKAHPIYFELLAKKQQKKTDAIFVLQSQLTDGKGIFGPKVLEEKQDTIMTEYINNLPKSRYFEGINVIMRDFLTPKKCLGIINLNIAKGYLKDSDFPKAEE